MKKAMKVVIEETDLSWDWIGELVDERIANWQEDEGAAYPFSREKVIAKVREDIADSLAEGAGERLVRMISQGDVEYYVSESLDSLLVQHFLKEYRRPGTATSRSSSA